MTHKEYQVQAKRKGEWLRASWRSGHLVPIAISYERACEMMQKAIAGWQKLYPLGTPPTEWRIVCREVTDWEEVTE